MASREATDSRSPGLRDKRQIKTLQHRQYAARYTSQCCPQPLSYGTLHSLGAGQQLVDLLLLLHALLLLEHGVDRREHSVLALGAVQYEYRVNTVNTAKLQGSIHVYMLDDIWYSV